MIGDGFEINALELRPGASGSTAPGGPPSPRPKRYHLHYSSRSGIDAKLSDRRSASAPASRTSSQIPSRWRLLLRIQAVTRSTSPSRGSRATATHLRRSRAPATVSCAAQAVARR